MERQLKKSTPSRTTGEAKTTRTVKATGVRKRTSSGAGAAAKATTLAATTSTAVLDAPNRPEHEAIALRAHLLCERAGHPTGRDQEFWLEAERELVEERSK